MKGKKSVSTRYLWFFLVILGLILIYMLLKYFGLYDLIMDTEAFKAYVIEMGYWGGLLIIVLMAFAILFKLLPSAAVALVSGAVYGHTWGTIYVIIGAWIGAIIAFSITRILGLDALYRLSGRRIHIPHEQSQSWLMWGLFVSRLIPVIPYDIVSYAMGLTPLKLWRFSLATLIGVIPTSFILAHFGGELMVTDFNESLSAMMIAGLIIVLIVILVLVLMYHYGYGTLNALFFNRKHSKNKSQ